MKLLLFIFLLSLAACGKDPGVPPDNLKPQVSITAPTAGQAFTANQPVTIKATASDNEKLARVHVEILNVTADKQLAHDHFIPAGKTYELNTGFTPTAAAAYRIKVEAEDGSGNLATAVVNVTVN